MIFLFNLIILETKNGFKPSHRSIPFTILGMIAFIFFTKGEENFNLYKFSFFFIVLPFIFYQFIFYIL